MLYMIVMYFFFFFLILLGIQQYTRWPKGKRFTIEMAQIHEQDNLGYWCIQKLVCSSRL